MHLITCKLIHKCNDVEKYKLTHRFTKILLREKD